jgi:uncharacterized protein YndB with AHSA1/START domain
MEIERTVDLPAEPDEVWEALTDDDARQAWFGDDADLEALRAARIDDADPGRRLAWTWWPEGNDGDPSTVQITLVPVPGGTRLTVIEAFASATTTARLGSPLVGLELLLIAAAPIRC